MNTFSSLPMMVIFAIVAAALQSGVFVTGAGIAYSPFHHKDYSESTSQDKMRTILSSDLSQIKKNCFQQVRTYHSSFMGVSVAEMAAKANLKIALGVQTDSGHSDYQYKDLEMKTAVEATKKYSSNIQMVLVGSENIKNGGHGHRSPEDVLGKIKSLKSKCSPGTKIGTSQRINEWLMESGGISALIQQSDIVGVNIYPFFTESKDSYRKRLDSQWKQVSERAEKACKGCSSKLVLTETGYPTAGSTQYGNKPSLENAKKYFGDYKNWAKDNQQSSRSYYFKFFDLKKPVPGKDFEEHFGVASRDGKMKFDTCQGGKPTDPATDAPSSEKPEPQTTEAPSSKKPELTTSKPTEEISPKATVAPGPTPASSTPTVRSTDMPYSEKPRCN